MKKSQIGRSREDLLCLWTRVSEASLQGNLIPNTGNKEIVMLALVARP